MASILGNRPTRNLVKDFILTGKMYDAERDVEKRMNLATVRGWLMDEIERRDPEGYERWLDSDLDDDGMLQFIRC